MKKKPKPRFLTIKRAFSPISWFNHWIGETFEILNISKYDFAEIKYMDDWKGWVPLECCETHFFRPMPQAIGATEIPNEVRAEEHDFMA